MAKTKKLKNMTLEEIYDIETKHSPMIGQKINKNKQKMLR